MSSKTKILIIILAVTIVLIAAFLVLQKSRPKLIPAHIQITKSKSQYGENESIVIAGLSKENSKITVFWNKKIGVINSDNNGNWSVNLGSAVPGEYSFQVVSEDSPTSNSIDTVKVSVVADFFGSGFLSFVEKSLSAGLTAISKDYPKEIIMVSQQVPPILQNKWDLLK